MDSITDRAKQQEYDGSTMLTGAYSVMRELFVDNIMAGIVQYKAYKQAGYDPNQTDNAAMASSTALLRNPKVKARLAYKRRQLAAKTELTAEKVVKKLQEIAFNEQESEKINTHHQLSALDMINKHLGLYERDNEQKRDSIFDILAVVGLKAGDDRLPLPVLTAPAATQGLISGDNDV